MRLLIALVCTIAVVGCTKKLSKEAALGLLNQTGSPSLECNTLLAGLDYDSAGMQFWKEDDGPGVLGHQGKGCGKKLEQAGFLTNVQCNKTKTVRAEWGENFSMQVCTANLAKGARLSGHGNTSEVLFPCGNAHYVIDSLMTEGRHATVLYDVRTEQTIMTEGLCALTEPTHGGTFTASLNDDGIWIMDGAR
jgi:hypothetical protein